MHLYNYVCVLLQAAIRKKEAARKVLAAGAGSGKARSGGGLGSGLADMTGRKMKMVGDAASTAAPATSASASAAGSKGVASGAGPGRPPGSGGEKEKEKAKRAETLNKLLSFRSVWVAHGTAASAGTAAGALGYRLLLAYHALGYRLLLAYHTYATLVLFVCFYIPLVSYYMLSLIAGPANVPEATHIGCLDAAWYADVSDRHEVCPCLSSMCNEGVVDNKRALQKCIDSVLYHKLQEKTHKPGMMQPPLFGVCPVTVHGSEFGLRFILFCCG
jgi:hypothetical protein